MKTLRHLALPALLVLTLTAPLAGQTLTWSNATSMNTARVTGAAVVLNDGKVLVTGGRDADNNALNRAEIYDPATNTWSNTGNMVNARWLHKAEKLSDGRVLVMGGRVGGATTEIYNPATGTFTAGPNMAFGRDDAATVVLADGRVLNHGGWNGATQGQIYDPATNTWTSMATSVPRITHELLLLPNGKVLMIGSFGGGAFDTTTYLYDPVANTWTASGALNTGRYNTKSVLLTNGKVLTTTAPIDGGNTNTCELYDIATGTWSYTGSSSAFHGRHHVGTLGDGRVVAIAGGTSAMSIYNPATGTWATGSPLSTSRQDGMVVRLLNGKFLAIGGYNGNATVNTVEIFDGPAVSSGPANNAPTDIALSAATLAENNAANATIGTLSATDSDSGQTHTFSLVAGTGDTDNAAFNISGTSLRLTGSADFEIKSSYSVRIQANDGAGGTYAKAFTVTITNANDAPTDIALSASSIAENNAANAAIGTLSATDADAGAAHTFSLVSGTGDTDNAAFNISGTALRLTGSADFETKSSYSLRVQADDGAGGTFAKALTVTITDVNEAPTDIALSASSIAENNAANATVGSLSATDVDAGSTHTFSLVAGNGDTDNAAFNISGTALRLTGSTDFETKSSYTVRIQANDGAGGTFAKAFAITITNANDAPTDIALSASSIAENNAANATVGTLSATDVDAGSTHTFSLAVGTGDTDNAAFNINGNALRLTGSADFETKSSYTVRIQADDGNGGTFGKAFSITITNGNDAPTDIALSDSTLAENNAANAAVGTLSAADPDSGQTHTFSLVAGTGDTDNAAFDISGTALRLTGSADFETKSNYSVRVQANDGAGGTFAKVFTIAITDANDAPTDIVLSASSIAENNAANATIGTLSASDVDAGATHTFSLVSGTGDTDNAAFNISGTALRLTGSADFETKTSYSVRLQANDGAGGTFAKALTISVTNVNEAPLANAQCHHRRRHSSEHYSHGLRCGRWHDVDLCHRLWSHQWHPERHWRGSDLHASSELLRH